MLLIGCTAVVAAADIVPTNESSLVHLQIDTQPNILTSLFKFPISCKT